MLPVAEAARLGALRSYEVLDSSAEPRLDVLAEAAARVCGTPMGLVSLVDRDRQIFKARFGVALAEIEREGSFCGHAIHQQTPLVVPDAQLDPRFSRHPLVAGEPFIRFYAGAPLISLGGPAVGTLCVLDRVPRTLDPQQISLLQLLAAQVISFLEQRKADLARRRMREVLQDEMKRRLTDLSRLGAEMQDERGLAVFAAAEGALQVVDDCIDVAAPPPASSFQRRTVDLAQLAQSLIEVLHHGSVRPLFSAAGDCRGRWDPDRIAQALSAFLDDALSAGPGLRVEACGYNSMVSLHVQRARASARPALLALRLDLARALIQAHGGSVDERPSAGGVALTLSLPR